MKIDEGIPQPNSRQKGPQSRYPFSRMEVGDSFLVEGVEGYKVRNAASRWGRANGKQLTVSRMVNGYRCWRVK